MSILIFKDAKTAATAAATLVASQLLQKPESVLGVEYGESMVSVFDSLSAMTMNGLLDWSRARLFQLTELVKEEGQTSLLETMEAVLTDRVQLPMEQYYSPDDTSFNWANSCWDFEDNIRHLGGLDLSLITIHPDGAVLYNGAGGEIAPTTHVELYEGKKTVTLGLPSLMESKKLVVLITGEALKEAAANCLKGPLNSQCPASLLTLHEGATFLLDEEAAALLG